MTDRIYAFIKKNRVRAYLMIMLFLTLIFYATCLFDNSNLKSILFFSDTDTFMDYMHNLTDFPGLDLYLWAFGTAYPAGAVLVFKVFRLAVMKDYVVGGSIGLREYQSALMFLLIYTGICTFITCVAIQAVTKLNRLEKDCLCLIVMLSMPMMFALERANVIILAFALTFVFIAFSTSEKKWVRAIAYIALGLAASMKIYPAIFGFYVLKKRGFKSALKLAVIGVLIFYITFVPFGGMKAIAGYVRGTLFFTGNRVVENEKSAVKQMIEDTVKYEELVGEYVERDPSITLQIKDNNADQSFIEENKNFEEKVYFGGLFKTIEKGSLDMGTDYAYNISFKNGWRLFENINGLKASDKLRSVVLILGVILVGINAAITRSSWKELLSYSIIMILAVPFSAPYTLLFLFIPFIFYLNDILPNGDDTETENKVYEVVSRIIYAILFAALILPYVSGLSVPAFEKDGQFALPYRTLINVILLFLTAIVLSCDGVRELIIMIKSRKHSIPKTTET